MEKNKDISKKSLSKFKLDKFPTRQLKFSNSSIKSITWWDNQIKLEISSIKGSDTYKKFLKQRRLEKKKFNQSLSSLLSRSLKSMNELQSSDLRPGDLAVTIRKFINKPKNTARIWQMSERKYSFNPLDTYDKIEQEMTNEFLEYYNSNIGDNNRSVDELLKKLFSTKVDPLFSYLRVITNSCKLLPDTTVKYMDKPKMQKSEMIKRLIHKDLKSLEKRTVAFGSAIQKSSPPLSKYDFKSKYKNIGNVHEDLKSFEHVWGNILNLETTKAFCEWLKKNEHIEPPAYLLKMGGLSQTLKSKEKLDELLWKNIEEIKIDYNESFEFLSFLSKQLDLPSNLSMDSSLSSPVPSMDISDINIII